MRDSFKEAGCGSMQVAQFQRFAREKPRLSL